MRTSLPIPVLSLAVLTWAALDQHQIACNSFGISDGYQGHQEWRAHDEHCQNAIDDLIKNFGNKVPVTDRGCTSLSSFEQCEVTICDDYNVRQTISYETVWAAANAVHSRHRSGQTVAGYVSIDDYTVGGNLFRRFVMVAKKGVPDPSNKRRRSLFGRRTAIGDSEESESHNTGTSAGEIAELVRRVDEHEFNLTQHDIPNTDNLNVNVQAGWGPAEWTPNDQMQNGMDNLLEQWNRVGADTGSILRAPGYLAPNNIMIEFEFGAHQFEPTGAVHYEERATVLRELIQLRGNQGNYGNFAAQLRRGTRIIGHVIIRVFRLGIGQNVDQVCG